MGRAAAAEVRNISIINGPNYFYRHDALRRRVEELRARSDYPQGMLRQFDAILGTGSLLRYTGASPPRLSSSTAPMTDGAAAQRPKPGQGDPGARFVVVDGMGHDLPEPVWRPIIEALTENFALAR